MNKQTRIDSITLDEANFYREEMENEIGAAVEKALIKFTSKTGLLVNSIDLEIYQYETDSIEPSFRVHNVNPDINYKNEYPKLRENV